MQVPARDLRQVPHVADATLACPAVHAAAVGAKLAMLQHCPRRLGSLREFPALVQPQISGPGHFATVSWSVWCRHYTFVGQRCQQIMPGPQNAGSGQRCFASLPVQALGSSGPKGLEPGCWSAFLGRIRLVGGLWFFGFMLLRCVGFVWFLGMGRDWGCRRCFSRGLGRQRAWG